jgi:hypothetical protein
MKPTFYAFVFVFPLLFSTAMQSDSCSNKRNSGTGPSPKPSVQQPGVQQERQPPATAHNRRLSDGIWGGMNIALEVKTENATFEFDCARGVVTEPILLDKDGRFDVAGSYVVEGPGPAREGNEKAAKARYSGTVHDDTMTLKVQPVGADGRNFSLTLGKFGKIHKCY